MWCGSVLEWCGWGGDWAFDQPAGGGTTFFFVNIRFPSRNVRRDDFKGEKKKKRAEIRKNKKISWVFMVFSFVLSFFLFYTSSMFILYASFLDFFFGTDLGLDRLGFCFDYIFFLHHLMGGRSFLFWLLFIRYWVSLVSYTWGFYERCFFYAFCLWEGAFFFFFSFFTSLVLCVVLYPPQDQEVGGMDGKIDAGVDSVPGDGSERYGGGVISLVFAVVATTMTCFVWNMVNGHMVIKTNNINKIIRINHLVAAV